MPLPPTSNWHPWSKVHNKKYAAEIYERYVDELFVYVVRMLGGRQEAREVVQETFAKALAALRGGSSAGNPRAWLYRIARNTCMDLHRTRQRNPVPLAEEGPSTAPGPEAVLLREETLESVRRALVALPDAQREVILLRVLQGLTYGEISIVTGVLEGTLRNRFCDALENLRSRLLCRAEGKPGISSDADITSPSVST